MRICTTDLVYTHTIDTIRFILMIKYIKYYQIIDSAATNLARTIETGTDSNLHLLTAVFTSFKYNTEYIVV